MQLWEQQPGEGAKAYEAARIYFQMRAARSLDAVAHELSKSLPLIKRWSRNHSWSQRSFAYDQHMAEVEQSALDEGARREAEQKAAEWNARQERLREKEWAASEALIKRAETMLKWPVEEQRIVENNGQKITIIMPVKWRASDIARLLREASKLGRLATGAETDRHGNIDVSNLSDEELQRVSKTGRL